jgi:C1A family cysteine protease
MPTVLHNGHRYNRNLPLALPMRRMITHVSPNLASVVDLRTSCGPIKNQGSEGSCTGHAFSSAIEWVFRKYLGKSPILSPQFFYAEELLSQGNFPQDEGSDGVTGCGVAVSKGCCELTLYPYVDGQIVMPTPVQVQNALQYAMGAYHGLTGSDVAHSVLADKVPWSIEIGFNVPESFESQQVADTGVMPVPSSTDEIIGGHEVLIVGCDLGVTPTLRPQGSVPSFLVQNSWGADWGIKGLFWMPVAVVDDAYTDLKIIHSGGKWMGEAYGSK